MFQAPNFFVVINEIAVLTLQIVFWRPKVRFFHPSGCELMMWTIWRGLGNIQGFLWNRNSFRLECVLAHAPTKPAAMDFLGDK